MITASRLVALEARYGGRHETPDYVGGDRMADHGYAPAYAASLNAFVDEHGPPSTLVEIGILRGTGLAVWADVLPDTTVVGLDVDLNPFFEYSSELVERGAFKSQYPYAFWFDQATDGPEVFAALATRPAIVIDDASHNDTLTLRTLEAFLPHMAERFLYFVEDQPRHSRIHDILAADPRGLTHSHPHRYLTVLSR